jgi:hypothetical protein
MLKGDLKGETGNEIIAKNIIIIIKRSGIENQISCDKNITNRNREEMYNVYSFMIQWNGSYRHVQYWQKNNTYRDMIQFVLNCIVTYARKLGKIIK